MEGLRFRREAPEADRLRSSHRRVLLSPPGGGKSHFISEFARIYYGELLGVFGRDVTFNGVLFRRRLNFHTHRLRRPGEE